jgi:prepilin signal peptidase PulO-like enzyme (type II secretory pathway)
MTLFFYIFSFIFGTIAGSFLNACVWRFNQGISVAKGRSMCPKCRKQIAWFDNIPIVSFFVLKGKCRQCRERISWQYPLVEIGVGLVFLIIAFINFKQTIFIDLNFVVLLFRDWIIVWLLGLIFVYDWKYMEVLDSATFYPAVILFVLTIIFGWIPWQSLIIGCLVGAGFFFFQYIISGGKWVGGGDIRIGFLMGAILGFPKILATLFLAYILGAITGVIIYRKVRGVKVPFGTFLALGTFITMVWGDKIVGWYVKYLMY